MTTNTILVVDDEPMIVALTSRALRQHGYKVLCATGPREALELIQRDLPVALVLSDVVMPDMHGPELIQAIKKRSPSSAAVLMSGNVGADTIPPGIPFLPKPLSLSELLSTVEKVLALREACALPPGRERSPAENSSKRTA